MSKLTKTIAGALGAAAFAASGCGVEFDLQSKIETFRILAIRSDTPLPGAGEQVTLDLLFDDGSPAAPRAVQVAWLWGCYNPPGDIYLNCAASLADLGASLSDLPAGAAGTAGAAGAAGGATTASGALPDCSVVSGAAPTAGLCRSTIAPGDAPVSSMTMTLPSATTETSRGVPYVRQSVGGVPGYGLGIVFFAACAGEVSLDLSGGSFPPFTCRDSESGASLGSDDFVVGYRSLYSYEEAVGATNSNPVIQGFTVGGKAVTPDCLNDECLAVVEPAFTDCDAAGAACVDACADDGDEETCPSIDIEVTVDESIREEDDVARAQGNASQEEVIWVRYFASAGTVTRDTRLINASTEPHWNPEREGNLYAPNASGPITVWGVVRDNRGGVGLVRQTLIVR